MERPAERRGMDHLLNVSFGWLPARMALAIMSFFGFINLYMVRLNLSVIIVAMVGDGQQNSTLAACTTHHNTTISANGQAESSSGIIQGGDLDWSETIQGFVLGSFQYGYATSQIVGGRAAEVHGTRLVFGLCILSGGLLTLLVPIASRWHYGALIALRILQGALQGVSWPSMHALLTRWIPPLERPRFIAYVYFATALSTSLTLPLCGLIVDQLGWPAAYNITGCLSLVWCLFWFSFMYDSPNTHPRISESERLYIESVLKNSGSDDNGRDIRDAPWCRILTSLPVWAIIIHGVGNNWGIALFYSQLPTYMKNIIGFSIKANGALSALPFLSRYLGCILWASLGDYFTSKGVLSVLTTRKIACFISMCLPGALLVCLAYNGCGWEQAVALMCLALFFNGAISASYIVNHTDIAPNFAGTIFGIDNTVGAAVSFIVPVMVGVMTDGQQTVEQWKKVFWTCVPLYGLCGLFFLFFASASVQSWNYHNIKYKTQSRGGE